MINHVKKTSFSQQLKIIRLITSFELGAPSFFSFRASIRASCTLLLTTFSLCAFLVYNELLINPSL